MHERGKQLFRLATGKEWDRMSRRPKAMEVIEKAKKQIWSHHPLRSLGLASDGETLLAEEDRQSHIHILGSPGEGKSKFLELLIRQDIQAGYGACLLDPSENAGTAHKILNFCIKQGFTKILWIDPHQYGIKRVNRLPVIQPMHYAAPANVSAGNLMDTIRVLWGNKFDETPVIQKYLPSILRVLHKSGMTLSEAVYFTVKGHEAYKARREQMLSQLHPFDRDRVSLEEALKATPHLFTQELGSTSRRLEPFFDDVMKVIVGSKTNPVNFQKLITEGWLVLVNLDPRGVWQQEQQRLLGTLVLNELIYAESRLQFAGDRKHRYYVYIDEVGHYATRKLAEVLDYGRHSNLSFTFAHQRFNQIEDLNVRSAIEGSAKIKVLFNTPSRTDRDQMLRMMYGGDVPDRQVSYELGQLQKQYAAVKINKQPPRITRIPDIPDIEVPAKVVSDFKAKLCEHEWYRAPREVLNEINARFARPNRTVHPKQSGESGEHGKPKGSRKTVAKDSAAPNDRANSSSRPSSPTKRPVKSVFSEEDN